MTGKLLMHTVLCVALVAIFAVRMRSTSRKRTMWAFIVGAAIMGLSPFLYRLLPGIYPRMTIHLSQLAFLTLVVVWFTPHPVAAIAVTDEDTDTLPPDLFVNETDHGGLPLH